MRASDKTKSHRSWDTSPSPSNAAGSKLSRGPRNEHSSRNPVTRDPLLSMGATRPPCAPVPPTRWHQFQEISPATSPLRPLWPARVHGVGKTSEHGEIRLPHPLEVHLHLLPQFLLALDSRTFARGLASFAVRERDVDQPTF